MEACGINLIYHSFALLQELASYPFWPKFHPLKKVALYQLYITAKQFLCGQKGRLQNLEKALIFLKQAANENLAEAQFMMGVCNFDGMGIKWNNGESQEGAEWFRRAYENGLEAGKLAFALCLYHGRGVSRSREEAYRVVREVDVKRIARDDGFQLCFLSDCYEADLGVRRDSAEALDCYERAAYLGNWRACEILGTLYRWRFYNDPGHKEIAFNYYLKAAVLGYSVAQVKLSNMFSRGEGVQKDDSQAKFWSQKASIQGNTEEIVHLSRSTEAESSSCWRWMVGCCMNCERSTMD